MPSKKLQFIIKEEQIGMRLDKFIANELSNKSRTFIQNAISNAEILVNNKIVKTGYQLKLNDYIAVNLAEKEEIMFQPENIPLDLLYEDEYLLVVNKPAGLVVHPGAGNKTGTLVNALLFHCKELSSLSGNIRPGIVHRLDKNTSGLLMVAKNNDIHKKLQELFISRSIHRIYHGIVWGVPSKNEGEIESNITRDRRDRKKMTVSFSKGKEAVTTYTLLKDFKYLSLLALKLKTGRTHQIRVHLNSINLPVFGDPEYNGRKSQIRRLPSHLQKRGTFLLKKIQRQSLHAKVLVFEHPVMKKQLYFESDLPVDMKNVLNSLEDVLLLK